MALEDYIPRVPDEIFQLPGGETVPNYRKGTIKRSSAYPLYHKL